MSIARHHLVLPFVALEDYRQSRQSFSLDRKRDAERAADAFHAFMRASQDPHNPKRFDRLAIDIDTYGWNDFNTRQVAMCPLLTRQWARSACDNPWAAVQQSLPARIELVDLGQLQLEPRVPRCVQNGMPRRPLPQEDGEVTMVCEEEVYGAHPGKHHVAVVRIDGDLGAAWDLFDQPHAGETAKAMMLRQGQAIVALVRHGLGASEDFAALHDALCALKAPNAPRGTRQDCGTPAMPARVEP